MNGVARQCPSKDIVFWRMTDKLVPFRQTRKQKKTSKQTNKKKTYLYVVGHMHVVGLSILWVCDTKKIPVLDVVEPLKQVDEMVL